MIETYDFAAIEAKWQRAWEEQRAFAAVADPSRPKFYLLEMYPYPSGRIHMGHVRNYSIGDVIARQKIMAGYSVLHPIGWDALGMPAENAAIKHGTHPRTWTLDNVGPSGLAHRRRGQPARNTLGPEVRDRVLSQHEDRYADFNDTHFTEMLAQREGLKVSRETVRRWRRQAGIKPKRRRRPPQHRSRRPRRPQMGLLMQWDGSPHRWFGPERPPCSLLHAADDATSIVLGALFRPTEDAIGYLKLLDMVLRTYGAPAAVYQDRHSALFRNDTKWTLEEELAGIRFPTHVGWVLNKIHIASIPA